jgi:hypothetical protein
MELTLPEGSSKGYEQLALFHLVGFPLEVEEARVLVTSCSITQPESPMVALGPCSYRASFAIARSWQRLSCLEGSQVSRSQAGSRA